GGAPACIGEMGGDLRPHNTCTHHHRAPLRFTTVHPDVSFAFRRIVSAYSPPEENSPAGIWEESRVWVGSIVRGRSGAPGGRLVEQEFADRHDMRSSLVQQVE